MREHTKVKLELLEKYLKAWIPILGKYHPRVIYVDGFAGRGQYILDAGVESKTNEGSPIRAMRVAQSMKGRVGEFVALFVEKDRDNYLNLRKTVSNEQSSFPDVKPEVIHGEFASVIGKILDDLDSKGQRIAPAFFFIDPFGFGGVPFEMIKRIMSKSRTEVFFTFMSRDINRFVNSPQHSSTLDKLFGCPDWKKIGSFEEERKQEGLVNLYRQQLMRAGIRYVWPFKVSHTDRRQVFYHLLHASNHFKALMIMKTIMYGQGAAGTFSYFGPNEPVLGKDQVRLLSADLSELKAMLMSKFAGLSVSFIDTMERTWDTRYVEKEYRAALKELKAAGIITVKPVSSRTTGGLAENDIITFASEE